MQRRFLVLAGAACVALAACATMSTMQPAMHAAFGSWGFDLAGMDTSVKPGDDFYLYANGKWLAAAQIPADRTRTGSFENLGILSENRMKEIAADIEAKRRDGLAAEELQLRDLYDAFLDTKAHRCGGLGAGAT